MRQRYGQTSPVRQRQRQLGWTDDEAALRVRIEPSRYLAIAQGTVAPDPREIEQIVDAMALARRDLAEWTNRSRPQDSMDRGENGASG